MISLEQSPCIIWSQEGYSMSEQYRENKNKMDNMTCRSWTNPLYYYTNEQSSNISDIGLRKYSNFFIKPSMIPIFINCKARHGTKFKLACSKGQDCHATVAGFTTSSELSYRIKEHTFFVNLQPVSLPECQLVIVLSRIFWYGHYFL